MNATDNGTPVLIVTVLYRQTPEQTNVFRTLLDGAEHVYIHDNSPVPASPRCLPEGWTYRSDPSNPGLSAAYNAAARHARSLGIEWMLIADQDTAFPEGMIAGMRALIAAHPDEKLFLPAVRISNGSYLSPVRMRGYMARPAGKPLSGMVDLRTTAAINSGLMVNVDAFIECGGYNERVPLDFSDFQFLERFAALHPSVRVADMVLRQSFSDKDDDNDARLRRFELFCSSLAGYDAADSAGRRQLTTVVLKRTLSLAISTRSLRPLAAFRNRYLRQL